MTGVQTCALPISTPFASSGIFLVFADGIEKLYDHFPALRDKRILLVSFIPTVGLFYSDDIADF